MKANFIGVLKKSFSFLILVCSVVITANAYSAAEYKLEMGDVKLVDVGEVKRVVVGDDGIVSVNVLETGMMVLIPVTPGKTQVKVWKTGERMLEYNVTVYTKQLAEVFDEIQSIVSGYKSVKSRLVGDKVILEGTVDPTQSESFQQALAAFDNVVSLVEIKRSKKEMIRLKVKVLEVDKRYRKELGIRWGDTANGPVVGVIGNIYDSELYRIFPQDPLVDFSQAAGLIPAGDNHFFPYSGLASTLTSRIQLIQENGAGRILAEPTLSTQSGTEASFLAGGEIPFSTVNQLGQTTIQFREYGIQLNILPEIDEYGNVISDVNAEVSSIDAGVAVQGVPGLLTRRTTSTVSLKPGQTIAISGLLSSLDNRNIDSLPFLGDIPVLGKLFSSKAFQEQRTEVVFLVTPEIVDMDQEPNLTPALKKHLESMQQIMGGSSAFSGQLAE